MFCSNCGKEVNDGTKFCQYCGEKILDMQSEVKQENIQQSGISSAWETRKIVKLTILMLGVIGMFVAIIFCIKHNNSSNQFVISIKEGNYETANQIYYQKIVNDYEEKLATEKLVTEDIEGIVKDYYDGKTTYMDAHEQVNAYIDFFPTVVDAALIQITNLNSSRNNYMTAKEHFDRAEYYAAWRYYNMVIPEDSNYDDASSMAEKSYEKYIETLKLEIEELWGREEYQKIIELCDSVTSELKSKEVEWISNVRAEMEGLYITQVINVANAWLSNGGIESAEALIEGALANYPQNVSLQEMQIIIREYYPVYLGKKFLTDSDMWVERSLPHFDTGGPYYDTHGNSYESANRYWTSQAYSKEEDIIYDTYTLNGEYTHFSAFLAPRSRWKDASNEGQTIFYIVGDGNVLYSTYMDKRSEVHTIDLDITNVKELKIGMNGGSYVDLLLAEPYIYKRY